MNNFEGKTVLLTGAFGLFGREISKAFLENGANVILAGHNIEKIKIGEKDITDNYNSDRFLICQLELCNITSIEDCIRESIKKFHSIDILINNAAVDAKFDAKNLSKTDLSRFENFPVEKLRSSIEINMLGTIRMTQVVCKQMLKQGHGNIINVGSIYSIIAPNKALYDFGNDENAFKPVDYVVSKSFIPNFTRYVAVYYAKEGIRCNAIAPHGVYDNHDKNFVTNFSKLSPVGRMCKKEELGGPFLFLASDSSSYLNGHTLVLDGGWTAW